MGKRPHPRRLWLQHQTRRRRLPKLQHHLRRYLPHHYRRPDPRGPELQFLLWHPPARPRLAEWHRGPGAWQGDPCGRGLLVWRERDRPSWGEDREGLCDRGGECGNKGKSPASKLTSDVLLSKFLSPTLPRTYHLST